MITDAQEGITAYDTHLRFTLWNPFMEELTGIPQGDVVGKRLEERFPQFNDLGFPEILAGLKGKRLIFRCAGRAFDKKEEGLAPVYSSPLSIRTGILRA